MAVSALTQVVRGGELWARRAATSALLVAVSACMSSPTAVGEQPRDRPGVGAELELTWPGDPATDKCVPIADASFGLPIRLKQTFLDDFSEFNLASQRWLPHYDGGYDPQKQVWLGYDWGPVKRTLQANHEQQLYVDAGFRGTAKSALGLDPFSLSAGVLTITASPIPPAARGLLYDYEYMSGLITSRASLVQTYGYFEMRARVPAGKGLWPAFWLLNADKQWPPEIDVLEVVGQQPELMVTSTHYVGPDGKRAGAGCRTRLPKSWEAFHTFGVLWTPERIIYYIDRKPIAQLATPPGVDKPMYMLLNLAVGGTMVGRADQETPMPARMEIDWVAAYQLPGHPACDPRRSATEMSRCWPK